MSNGLDQLHNRIEAIIATAIVDAALSRGWLVTVYDGEENAISKSLDRQAIIDAMASTDEDVLVFHKDTMGLMVRKGWLQLIYGNDQDVISDYSAAISGKSEIEKLVDEVDEKLKIAR